MIPFYINITEKNIWRAELSLKYYQTFVSQYISFIERDAKPVSNPLTLEQIKKYGISKSIAHFVTDVDSMIAAQEERQYDAMWNTAGSAPHRYQGLTNGTLYLILQNRFKEKIATYQPELPRSDLKQNFHEEIRQLEKEKKSLQGMINHLSGMMAEYQLTCEFRSQKRFTLSRFFTVKMRFLPERLTESPLRCIFS